MNLKNFVGGGSKDNMAIFNPNGKPKLINVDMDGTLTNGEAFWHKRPTPNPIAIELVKQLYQAGNHIIIWTARAWEYAPETVGWLIEFGVPYHGLYMQKGGSDLYIDDKAIHFTDDLTMAQIKELFGE